MGSQAVNYRSFMNAIGNKIGVDSTYLHKFIIASSSDYGRILSVKEAISICEVFLTKMGLSTSNISTPTNRNVLNALSANTALAIINKYIGYYTWTVYADTNNIGNLNSGIAYRVIIKDTIATSTSFDVTAVGGGAGGGGASTLDGSKNSNYNINYLQGYAGSNSTLSINGTTVLTASGGASQGSTYYAVGKNPASYTNGKDGYAGSSNTTTITIKDGDYIVGVKGAGGGGTGGLTISSAGSSTYNNYRNGVCVNEWSEDTAFAGGGGQGGYDLINAPGSSTGVGGTYSTVQATNGQQDSKIGVVCLGGTGGYNSNGTTGITQPPQSSINTSAGGGGYGGRYAKSQGVYNTSSGGNGGNSGTITGTANTNIIFLRVS